jgi:hypothetical protein
MTIRSILQVFHVLLCPPGHGGYLKDSIKIVPVVASIQDQRDFDRIKDKNLIVIGGPKFTELKFQSCPTTRKT